jgi:hypothetical protein
VEFLTDDDSVGSVPAATADGFGKRRSQKARGRGLAVQVAGQFAGAFPLVDVRQDLTFSEGAHGLSQLVALRGGPDAHDSKLSGRST